MIVNFSPTDRVASDARPKRQQLGGRLPLRVSRGGAIQGRQKGAGASHGRARSERHKMIVNFSPADRVASDAPRRKAARLPCE